MTADDHLAAAQELDGVPAPPWPGPDLYTLRGWVEVELALDRNLTVDAAHAMLTDAATRAFVVADDRLAGRVLSRLRERMAEDDEAPEPPDADFEWMAYSPDDRQGARSAYRRAIRRRRENARMALLHPGRPRIAGERRH